MAKNSRNAYGFGQGGPLPALTPTPVVSSRNPLPSDISFEIGTHWINTTVNNAWILTSITAGSSHWESVSQPSTGEAPISKYIVDADGSADYTTIQDALDAANAIGIPATVMVRPGTYAENLTLYDDISISGSDPTTTIIIGIHVPPAAGNVAVDYVTLSSATHIFNSAVAGTADIIVHDCFINITSGYLFNLLNWTGTLNVDDCGTIGTDDGFVNNTGGAPILVTDASVGAGTGNPFIASNGTVTFELTKIGCPGTFGGTATVRTSMGSRFEGTVTTADTAVVTILNSEFSTGATAAISHGSAGPLTLSDLTIDSSASPVIAGAGAAPVDMGNISYLDSSVIAATITQTYSRTINAISSFIVGPTGNFVTIQAALDAADASGVDQTVIVQPGIYTEDLTLYNGISISGNDPTTTTIIGIHVPPGSGNVAMDYVTLSSATHIFNSAVAGSTDIIVHDCFINVTNGYLFNLLNWTGTLNVDDCGTIGTDDGFVNNTGGATIFVTDASVGAGTGNPFIASNGSVTFELTKIGCPGTFGGTATVRASLGCRFEGTVTTADTAAANIINSEFSTGANSSISHGSADVLTLNEVSIASANATAIAGAGAGVITLGSITFEISSTIAGTLTLSNVPKLSSGGLAITEGANAQMGVATLVAGASTVATTAVTANSRIFLTHQTNAGTPGFVSVTARVAATSFTITSGNGADTSIIAWTIIEPN